jgi:hypothetical protein
MKMGYFLMLALAVLAGTVSAQTVEKIRRLKQDEVPVIIQQSLQKNFSSLTEKGSWKLMYQEDLTTRKLTPEFYTYSCKRNGERVEIYYKSDGTLDHAKGIAAPAIGSQP